MKRVLRLARFQIFDPARWARARRLRCRSRHARRGLNDQGVTAETEPVEFFALTPVLVILFIGLVVDAVLFGVLERSIRERRGLVEARA